MLTPRRSGGAFDIHGLAGNGTRAGLPVDTFDPCNDGLGAQLGDDSAEMLEVIDLEVDGQLGEIGRAARHADIVDVAIMFGDHGRDLGETPGLVDVVDPDARREALRRRFIDVPADVEPPLRLFLEILQVRRLDRIDRDALARRDNADDAVAWNRAPVGRELDGQIGIDAADRYSRGVALRIGRRFQFQLDRKTLLDGGAEAPRAFLLVVRIHRA